MVVAIKHSPMMLKVANPAKKNLIVCTVGDPVSNSVSTKHLSTTFYVVFFNAKNSPIIIIFLIIKLI